MANDRTRERILFDRAVGELRSAGCELQPHDYVEIYDAARSVVGVESGPSLFAIEPIVCGRAVLRVPSVMAMHWWETCGDEWYSSDDTMSLLAFAFMCHYANDRQRLERLYARNSADLAITRFRLWLGCSCTHHDLRIAIEELQRRIDAVFPPGGGGPTEKAAESASALVWGDTIARLCAAYHDLRPYQLAAELSVTDAYAMLRNAPDPFGVRRPEKDEHFSRFARFRSVVERIRKERAPCSA